MTNEQLSVLLELIAQKLEREVSATDTTVADLLTDHAILPPTTLTHQHPGCFGLFCSDPTHMVVTPGTWALFDGIYNAVRDIRAMSAALSNDKR